MRETCGRLKRRFVIRSFIHIRRYFKPATDDRGAILSKVSAQKSVTTSLLVSQWMCRSRKSMRNKNGEIFKHFLVKTSSESLPSRRNDTTLALLQPQPLFLSRFHSFLLRGRKFVFVSKSGRLALKKNVCAFGTYRRNRIESGRACVATVSYFFFNFPFLFRPTF